MDADRFFYEVAREEAEMDMINDELLELADAAREEVVAAQYQQFLQDVFGDIYNELQVQDWLLMVEENHAGCEFDI